MAKFFMCLLALANLVLVLGAPCSPVGLTPASYSKTGALANTVIGPVSKTVCLPNQLPSLDLILVVDTTGSYGDDLPNLKSKAGDIFDGVRSAIPDSQFAVAAFGDWCDCAGVNTPCTSLYNLLTDLTSDRSAFISAVNKLAIGGGGGDEPEAQLYALSQLSPFNSASCPLPAFGSHPTWRSGSSRVIALTTDASFHECGSQCSGTGLYPTVSEAVAGLVADKIRFIALKAPGSTTQMDTLASGTGGSVVTTDSASSNIVASIVSGVTAVRFNVTPVVDGCGLDFRFNPTSRLADPGTSIQFAETAVVPRTFTSDGHVENCQVQFQVNGAVSAALTQNFTVTLAAPPAGGGCTAVSCCNRYQVNTNCNTAGQCNIAAINLMDNSQIGAAQCNTADTGLCTVQVGGVQIPGPDGQPQPTCAKCPCTKKTINLKCTGGNQCNLCEIDQQSGSSIGCFQCNAAGGGTCSLQVN